MTAKRNWSMKMRFDVIKYGVLFHKSAQICKEMS